MKGNNKMEKEQNEDKSILKKAYEQVIKETKEQQKITIYDFKPAEFGKWLLKEYIGKTFKKYNYLGSVASDNLKEYYEKQEDKDKRTIDGFIAIINFISIHRDYIQSLYYQNMYYLEFFDKIITLFALAFNTKDLQKYSVETFLFKPFTYGFKINDIRKDFDTENSFKTNVEIMKKNVKKIVAFNEIIKIFFRRYKVEEDADTITFDIQRQFDYFFNIFDKTIQSRFILGAEKRKSEYVKDRILELYRFLEENIEYKISLKNKQRLVKKVNSNFDFMEIKADLIDYILQEQKQNEKE